MAIETSSIDPPSPTTNDYRGRNGEDESVDEGGEVLVHEVSGRLRMNLLLETQALLSVVERYIASWWRLQGNINEVISQFRN
jgi:hypothetical protein